MPTPSTSELPIPKSWDEFEDIVSDIYRELWADPYIQRIGRSGQPQNGVDILGKPQHLNGSCSGIQCKRSPSVDISTVQAEVQKAQGFEPPLEEFLIATTAKRDARLQEQIRKEGPKWPFRVEIIFWEDISLAISGYQNLLQKHFPGWAKSTTTKLQLLSILSTAAPDDFEFHDCPPQYHYVHDVDLRLMEDVDNLRGEYYEPWLDCFLSRAHYTTVLHLFWRNTRVETFYFINADGGRAYIPYPTITGNRRISPLQYNMAKIINGLHSGTNLDDALERTGISVDPNLGHHWPAINPSDKV